MLLRSRATRGRASNKRKKRQSRPGRAVQTTGERRPAAGFDVPYFIAAYRIVNLFLYLLTVIIWGTTWIAIKLQLGVVAIPVSIFYRFALAGLVLFAGLLLLGKLQKLDRRGHLMCLGQGLCLFCLNFLCFYTATQWIPSGLVSVVFSAATLWNALNARLWFGTASRRA